MEESGSPEQVPGIHLQKCHSSFLVQSDSTPYLQEIREKEELL